MMATMNNNLTTTRAFGVLALAIALIVGGYLYQVSRPATSVNAELATSTNNAAFALIAGEQSDSAGTTNIIPISDSAAASVKAPDFKRPLTFTGKFTDVEKAAIQANYNTIQAELTADPKSFNAWVFMGNINLIVGNYMLAKEYWDYASKVWPTNVATYNNLGDLYMSYLKDYPKAEAAFLKAIDNKGNDSNPYKNLFTLYSETSYKPTNTAAEDILKRGIAAVPRSVDMQYQLAVYYEKLGRTAEAKAMYQAAIDNATSQGQIQLATQIKADLVEVK